MIALQGYVIRFQLGNYGIRLRIHRGYDKISAISIFIFVMTCNSQWRGGGVTCIMCGRYKSSGTFCNMYVKMYLLIQRSDEKRLRYEIPYIIDKLLEVLSKTIVIDDNASRWRVGGRRGKHEMKMRYLTPWQYDVRDIYDDSPIDVIWRSSVSFCHTWKRTDRNG